MSNPRTDIERGVIALLQPLTRARGRYLMAVDHYNGEIQGKEGIDDIKTALLGRSPGVLVYTGSERTLSRSADRRMATKRFDVLLLVISTSLVSDKAQRVGDDVSEFDLSLDPGINQMLKDAWDLLERQKPLAGGQFLEHVDDGPAVLGGRGFTVWTSRYTVDANVVIPRVTGPIITTYEARNNIAPLTEPVPELPVNPVITTEGTVS